MEEEIKNILDKIIKMIEGEVEKNRLKYFTGEICLDVKKWKNQALQTAINKIKEI